MNAPPSQVFFIFSVMTTKKQKTFLKYNAKQYLPLLGTFCFVCFIRVTCVDLFCLTTGGRF